MTDINYMDIKEFREAGFLQEVNRQFFHPRGLALCVNIDDDTGEESILGVWDYRDDPEGVIFEHWENFPGAEEKRATVEAEYEAHFDARLKLFGSPEQRVGQEPSEYEVVEVTPSDFDDEGTASEVSYDAEPGTPEHPATPRPSDAGSGV